MLSTITATTTITTAATTITPSTTTSGVTNILILSMCHGRVSLFFSSVTRILFAKIQVKQHQMT